MPEITDLNVKLETLFEQRRQRAAELAEIEAECAVLDKMAKGDNLPPSQVKPHDRLRERLTKARQTVADLDFAMAEIRKAIERQRDEARSRPLAPRDRAAADAAAAYIAAAETVERSARDLAAALRQARELGEALAAATGDQRLDRHFWLGHFRQRVTAGLLRFFEADPDAPGVWGGEHALIELGESRRRGDIARIGFLEFERKGLRDTLSPNLGALI